MSCRRTPQPVPGTVWRWNQSLHKVLGIPQKLSTQHPWRALASAQKVQALCSHQGFGAKTRTRGWELPRAVDEGPQTAAEAPQAVPADLSLEHEVWLHSGRFFLFRLPPGRKWAAYKELTYTYLQPLHVQEDPRRHFTAAHVIFLVLDTIHAQHLQPGPQPIWKDLAQSLWYAVSLNAFALCFIEVICQWNLAFVGLLLFSWKKLDLHAGDLHQIQAWLQHKYHWQVPEHTTSNVLYIPMT